MYKSPIDVFTHNPIIKIIEEHNKQRDEHIYRRIIETTGVIVDKEELIKALKYDREQYRKGYMDGINDFAEKFRNRIDTGFTEYSTALTFSQMGIHRMILDILEELEG